MRVFRPAFRSALVVILLGFASSLSRAQLELQPSPTPAPLVPPPPPPTPPAPLEFGQPMPRMQPRQLLPLDQLRRMPGTNAGSLSATASFEPQNVRLGRFGEFRVTIIGASSGIEIPEPLPAPEGLFLELNEKKPGTALIGGQRVQTMTFIYSSTASRPDTYVVPSFSAFVSGSAITVPASQVTVQEPGPADLPYQPAQAVLDLPPGDYFVGQSIAARLIVFDTPDEAVQALANVTKPAGDFLFQSQPGARRDRVVWKGKTQSALVSGLRFTPIKPGETDVALQAIVFVMKMNAAGRFSGNTAQAMLDTPAVHLNVLPLPEKGRKPGFTGAIGRFELGRTQLSANEVFVGDPLTYTITLLGEGNLEAIAAPVIEEGDAWQTFSPTMDVNRDAVSGRGSKTITYTLIPRHAEVRAVPAIPFSYFDPERREYVDLAIPPTPLAVKPAISPAPAGAPTAPAATPAPEVAPPPVAKKAEPILTGLAEKPGAWRRSPSPAWSGFTFWCLQAIPGFSLLGLWLWRWRTDYLLAHPEVVRRRAARAAARAHLRRARSAAAERNAQGFVDASIDAIRAAASPLDTTSAESLVMTEVLAHSPASEANATVERLFQRAHAERFSGHAIETNGVFEMLPEVERTVAAIEKRQP